MSPIESSETLLISCDNPTCPGNDLDPNDRFGWTFATVEIYGNSSISGVFCCLDCLGVVAMTKDGSLHAPVTA